MRTVTHMLQRADETFEVVTKAHFQASLSVLHLSERMSDCYLERFGLKPNVYHSIYAHLRRYKTVERPFELAVCEDLGGQTKVLTEMQTRQVPKAPCFFVVHIITHRNVGVRTEIWTGGNGGSDHRTDQFGAAVETNILNMYYSIAHMGVRRGKVCSWGGQ